MSTGRSRTRATAAVSALQPRTSGLELSALWTLFTLTLRQFVRGKRMIVLSVLALLPAGLAVMVRTIDARHAPPPSEIEFVFLFNLVPQVLLPLTALLYASGMILDEQEEQTLTYLLIRPLPKWALYVTKLLATICMVAMLGLIYVVVTYLATYLGSGQFLTVFPLKMMATFVVMALAMMTYVALFGCMSLMIQRAWVAGIIYIVAIEGLMGNIDFAVRKLTVIYYFRVLSLKWLNVNSGMSDAWRIGDAPESITCVLTLLGVSAFATFLAARIFASREFSVKTPGE
jgi:ABC-2 type transport system permease protein